MEVFHSGMMAMPGWQTGSFGYHGDYGKKFDKYGDGTHYGPTFEVGDTIGCGININKQFVYFTKNSEYLGAAFNDFDIQKKYYPTVGMRSATGARVKLNHGHKEYKFDANEFSNWGNYLYVLCMFIHAA